jgi:hypothetical protein
LAFQTFFRRFVTFQVVTPAARPLLRY